MPVCDFHTHAFPDALADRAMGFLNGQSEMKSVLDGRISSLLHSMDRAGIDVSVVASIATKPSQFAPIMAWSRVIASDRIVPFPSLHPLAPEAVEQVRQVAEAGFRGIKLHPYYQEFDLDDPGLGPVFGELERLGLAVLCHTGFDPAYAKFRCCDPERILRVTAAFPRLRFVASHFGGHEDWDEVERVFLGKPVRTDISYSVQFMPPEKAKRLIESHPADCLLFGTDSPWADQAETLAFVRSLSLDIERERAILYDNAKSLLGLAG
jgi:uncharacterized protein